MSPTNPKVDWYFQKAKAWRDELETLRAIALGCQLTEEMRWGKPCYTFQNKNVVLIIGFKEYCALLFVKGALLKDPQNLLVKAGENTQAARQARFTSVREIVGMKTVLDAYLHEAMDVENAGLKVALNQAEVALPDELRDQFEETPGLKSAFDALTPGRRRAYVLHFSGAKQSKTRKSRVEKCVPQILNGKGLTDE